MSVGTGQERCASHAGCTRATPSVALPSAEKPPLQQLEKQLEGVDVALVQHEERASVLSSHLKNVQQEIAYTEARVSSTPRPRDSSRVRVSSGFGFTAVCAGAPQRHRCPGSDGAWQRPPACCGDAERLGRRRACGAGPWLGWRRACGAGPWLGRRRGCGAGPWLGWCRACGAGPWLGWAAAAVAAPPAPNMAPVEGHALTLVFFVYTLTCLSPDPAPAPAPEP